LILKNSVGISLTDKKITAILVTHSVRETVIEAQESWELGLSENKPMILAEKINAFIADQAESVSEIYIGIPADKFIIKTVSFPSAVKDNLREALRYEMEKIVPVNPDELVYDYLIVSESGGFINIEVFIFKKNDFTDYFAFADAVKGGASGVVLTSQAVHSLVGNLIAGTKKDNGLLVLGREGEHIEYSLGLNSGFYVGLLDKSAGFPDNLKQAIIESMSGNNVDYDVYSYRYGCQKDDCPDIFSDLTEIQEDLLKNKGLNENQDYGAYALASILDLSGNGILNFLPVPKRRKKDMKPFKIMILLSVALAVSIMFLIGAWYFKVGSETKSLEGDIEKLKLEAAAVEKLRAESDRIEEKVNGLALVFRGLPSTLDILREITSKLPPDSWIKQLNYRDGTIEIFGLSASSSSLIPLFESSEMFEEVKFLSPITKDKDGKDLFRIGMKLEMLKTISKPVEKK